MKNIFFALKIAIKYRSDLTPIFFKLKHRTIQIGWSSFSCYTDHVRKLIFLHEMLQHMKEYKIYDSVQ